MAKSSGISGYTVQLNNLVSEIQSEKVVEIADKAWTVIGDQIRINAIGINAVLTGLLIDPRTILTHAGVTNREGNKGFFAEAGVFKDDNAMGSYPHPSLNRNRNPKSDIPSATVAYWLEFGVQPHYLIKGVRARKYKVDGDSGVPYHKGVTARPFISKAYDQKLDQAYNILSKGLDDLIRNAVR